MALAVFDGSVGAGLPPSNPAKADDLSSVASKKPTQDDVYDFDPRPRRDRPNRERIYEIGEAVPCNECEFSKRNPDGSVTHWFKMCGCGRF
ncbi:hypothetical protein ABID82_005269 [Methylobacterium sp. PvP062]|uniref:Uncharacterized protein n=1 Tax=Methylobacterium radiotolerans TaxID=31998 RepID=A0ABV2NQB5_9HYPH|nr:MULTISPECIES: hypothetical protein [Methylobacterium]MBP2494606.1 hypothetical protein [Methylobacterium sp. PvP105]MBP2499020.1 hypothetical protein [Methylobacterium sp. PvP109]MCX7330079.1 hypothetical protein [Hyphomicrobiales bacterium]